MRPYAGELAALARHLGSRRDAILQAWRVAIKKDPELTTGESLPRSQINDHIPALLSTFERELSRVPEGGDAPADAGNEDAAAHGLQRWQQGYDLREVTRELGRLNGCMVLELEEYARSNPNLDYEVMATARRLWAALCSTGIEESTAQYFRLQQREATGHVRDLENALEEVREVERQRAELWRQAAHDLRGNLGVVANATAGLTMNGLRDPARENVLRMLQRNVSSLHHLLDDVTSLARLQAGKEQRQVVRVDAAATLSELCEGMRSLAQQRHLFLHCDGPSPFLVESDPVKLRRIAQNLILNAVKYTGQGGVKVSWGDSDADDRKRWALYVKDTGPGLHTDSGSPLAGALEKATQSTREPDAGDAAEKNSAAGGKRPPAGSNTLQQETGEGIGLSIVKRLCDLLDATIEMESEKGSGTSFRILLPRQYQTN